MLSTFPVSQLFAIMAVGRGFDGRTAVCCIATNGGARMYGWNTESHPRNQL